MGVEKNTMDMDEGNRGIGIGKMFVTGVITLLEQLAAAEKKLEDSDLPVVQTRTQFEEQENLISELQVRLADAEYKLIEGEQVRMKLHNTILDLEGNIRVCCRVRPLLPDDNSGSEGKVIYYPTSAEALGRGIDLVRHGI